MVEWDFGDQRVKADGSHSPAAMLGRRFDRRYHHCAPFEPPRWAFNYCSGSAMHIPNVPPPPLSAKHQPGTSRLDRSMFEGNMTPLSTQTTFTARSGGSLRRHCHRVFYWIVICCLLMGPVMASSMVNLTIGYLPTILGEHRDKQGLSISGAITYALERVRQTKLLPDGVSLNLQFNDTRSDLLLTTKSLTEMMCNDVVAVFGPENTCSVEATITSAWNRLMISHKCADHTVSDKKKFPTFVRTYPTETQVTKSIVALLQSLNWNKFSIVAEKSPRWQTVADSLEERVSKTASMTLNHRTNFEDVNRCCVNREACCHTSWMFNILEKTRIDTRIYVFLGETINLYDFMTTMQMMRLFNKGEYMVISVDWETYSPERAREYLWKQPMMSEFHNCTQLESPSPEAAKSLLMIVTTKPDENFDNFSEQVRKYNKQQPFNFNEPKIFDRFVRHVPMYAAHLYDAVLLYATALGVTLKEGNLTEPHQIVEAAKDGRSLFKRIIERRKYDSVTGASIRIDDNGDSEGNYTVLAVKFSNTSRPIAFSKTSHIVFHCHYEMVPVGRFDYNTKTTTPQFNLTDKISWVGDKPPLDEPPCGYRNQNCRKDNHRDRDSQIAAGILGFVLIAACISTIFLYRKWKMEQEIDGLVWKIDPADIIPHSIADDNKSTSKLSLTSMTVDQVYARAATYRGTIVHIKELVFSKRQDVICRKTKREIWQMREIRHVNINPFIGATVEPNRILIVTEYCHKGGLPDILENDDIKLDNLFIASLVDDLVKGMIYLHCKTDLPCHGNLKSSNCLITSRWVLQITDYGLHELRHSAEKEFVGDHERYRNLQWKAPELLRDPAAPLEGTQKADVYAFALILYEILTRQEAFGSYKMEPKAIVERIKLGPGPGEQPFRPDIQVMAQTEMGSQDYIRSCMEDCWAELPEQRPDFPAIRVRLREMRKGMKPFMDQMMEMMVIYANNLEVLVNERTQLLHTEKQKTEDLLHRILPEQVVKRLTRGFGVEPESYDAVTIYFSDIVGFTQICSESTPLQVVNFLNDVYTRFDQIVQSYDAYKVETIGDAYMVVSGLPKTNGDKHAGHIASMALDLLQAAKNYRDCPGDKDLLVRIGIHTGPVVTGVVGLTMPRYCLFGDTVNTASRMESTGEAWRIHISDDCRKALEKIGGYETDERGLVDVKGKGKIRTHWLIRAIEGAVERRPVVGPPRLPLFCRPSGGINGLSGNQTARGSSGNMSDIKRRSPRLLHRGESTLSHRGSAGGGRLSKALGRLQNSKLSNHLKNSTELMEDCSNTPSMASSRSTMNPTPSPTMYDRSCEATQSAKSLRTNRTKSNSSLRRSCLLSRSANASKTQVITEAASDVEMAPHLRSGSTSPYLTQRRCHSLGMFPGEENEGRLAPTGSSGTVGRPPRQFLCVPQVFPSGRPSSRRRRESKSLDLFPSELRSHCSDRSVLPSCPSNEDTEDEQARLLEEDIVLTVPDNDQMGRRTDRTNGHLKPTFYQSVRLVPNDDEGIDVNSESTIGRVQRLSLSASGPLEVDGKKWHSCEQLHHAGGGGDKTRSKENKDNPIASSVNKSVKQWLVNWFGGDSFSSKTPPTNQPSKDEYSGLHREDTESVV